MEEKSDYLKKKPRFYFNFTFFLPFFNENMHKKMKEKKTFLKHFLKGIDIFYKLILIFHDPH